MSKQHFKLCFCFKRSNVLEPPEGIHNIFNEFSLNGTMSMDDLCKFIVEFQGEEYGHATNKHAQAVIDRFQRRGFHVEAFFRYLLSDDHNAPLLAEVHHDMKFPLAHYFLYTSSESNLTETVSPIIKALKKGVRVIPLAIRRAPNNDVLVFHGGTMLHASVKLRACLKSIKEYAFYTSPYPVVIDFEYKIGDLLLLKGKVAKEEEDDNLEYTNLISRKESKAEYKNWWIDRDHVGQHSLRGRELENIAERHATDVIRFTQRNLLGIYPISYPINDPMIGWMHGAQMIARNLLESSHLLKYMEGMFRANGGCGYVKKPDILLNIGPNNEVFDPRASRPIQKTLQVEGMHIFWCTWVMGGIQTSAQHTDLNSPPNFYVQVGIIGVPADGATKHTRIIKDNWVPVWNEEISFPLTFPELALLHIEVLHRNIHERDYFGGQTCLPVSEIREGIRAVCLGDVKGECYNGHGYGHATNKHAEAIIDRFQRRGLHVEAFHRYLLSDDHKIHDITGQTYLPVSELREGICAVHLYDRNGELYKSVRLLIQFPFVDNTA
ncbi:hypothetical protein VNO77_31914 [Canavalia gladiata]|uniref:Phosphoinositide phospholipase C n=1 Tax=Canavalia gladiata TaxID=3824 RepID=A0AAN9KS46_CANGL